ncbi:MAG: response regulator [Myxococcota bacterium]|jgi:DNA-binding NtrC family response regulator|nr:response regulator [Myxococcota bacterium]
MSSDPAQGTILIVDDEAPLLRLISRVLEREGFATLTAKDGDEARGQLDEHRDEIAAAILDVQIPPNGVEEVVDHLEATCDGLAVIFASGDLPSPELSERIEGLGAAFLRKPFQPKAMVEMVRRHVEAGASAQPEGAP